MIDSTRPAGSSVGSPSLRLFGADPREDPGILIRINRPGTYELRIWTDEEFRRLPHRGKPEEAYRHGSTWFVLEASARGGGERGVRRVIPV